MDIDLVISRITEIIANNVQNELGAYLPENAERILSTLNSIDWEQFIVQQRIAERERRARWRKGIVTCPRCHKPEKRGVIQDHDVCNACQQEIWNAQARPCVICGAMYLALGHKRIETTAKYDLREIRVGATDGLF